MKPMGFFPKTDRKYVTPTGVNIYIYMRIGKPIYDNPRILLYIVNTI